MPFTASLEGDSYGVFSVVPSAGTLQPEAQGGSLLQLGFVPRQFGKTYRAVLRVVVSPCQPHYSHKSGDAVWKFEVVGVPPEQS